MNIILDNWDKAQNVNELICIKYGGSISHGKPLLGKTKKPERFQVCFNGKHIAEIRVSQFLSAEEAKKKAETIRINESVRLGLNVEIRRSNLSNERRQYFAGFIDGDGCIMQSKRSSISVRTGQASNSGIPKILEYLKETYGGTVYFTRLRRGNRRDMYEHVIRGFNCLPLLYDVWEYGILKAPQAKLAIEHLIKHIDYRDTNKESRIEELLKTCKRSGYATVAIDKVRLTPAYLSGFTDSEGCVRMVSDRSISVEIVQHHNVNIIHAINDKYGHEGAVRLKDGDKAHMKIGSDEATRFLQTVAPYSIEKNDQIQCALSLRKGKKRKLSEMEKEFHKIIKNDKRK